MTKTPFWEKCDTHSSEKNRIPSPKGRGIQDILKDHLFTYFNCLSLVMFVLLLFTGSYHNTLFMGVVVFNAVLGICQELFLKQKLDQLKTIRQLYYTAFRDGISVRVSSEDIIKGDILLLSSGDEIPCDMEVLSTDYLEANEAILTGESEPIVKQAGDTLFGGSFLVSGSCRAKAICVGGDTQYAKMVIAAGKYEKSRSLILEGIETIIKRMSLVILPLGILLFASTYYRGLGDWRAAVVTTAAGIIGMIPSGLYLITTVTATTAVWKLAKKQAVVNDFSGVEALSRVTTVCLDKTGTLTTGEMKVTQMIAYDASCEEILKLFCKSFSARNSTLEAIYQTYGDHTNRVADEMLSFSSARKYAQLISDGICYRLGAAERLVSRESIAETVTHWIKQGKRVLALMEEDTCLGLLILEDVLKEEAKDVLSYFVKENICLKLISGDHPETVSTIAKSLGFHGWNQFVDLSVQPKTQEHYRKLIKQYTIFGRATPEEKAALIHAMKTEGETVCMVGDGANDVLAMKEADLSVSMASGDQAAKSVSRIVLAQSDFTPLPHILQEGRRIVNNMERVAGLYLLKTGFSLLITLIFILLGTNYPFAPISITVIGVFTIGIPSFFLALEPNDRPVQREFLPSVLETTVPTAVLIGLFVGFFGILERIGILAENETISFYLTAFFCFFQLILCSGGKTRYQMMVLVAMLLGFFGCIFVPAFLPIGALSGFEMILLGACLCVGTVLLHLYHHKQDSISS